MDWNKLKKDHIHKYPPKKQKFAERNSKRKKGDKYEKKKEIIGKM